MKKVFFALVFAFMAAFAAGPALSDMPDKAGAESEKQAEYKKMFGSIDESTATTVLTIIVSTLVATIGIIVYKNTRRKRNKRPRSDS